MAAGCSRGAESTLLDLVVVFPLVRLRDLLERRIASAAAEVRDWLRCRERVRRAGGD